jgi:hypothetical protein
MGPIVRQLNIDLPEKARCQSVSQQRLYSHIDANVDCPVSIQIGEYKADGSVHFLILETLDRMPPVDLRV